MLQQEQIDVINDLVNVLKKNNIDIEKCTMLAKQIEKSIHKKTYNHCADNYKPLDWNSHVFMDAYMSSFQKIYHHIDPNSDINKQFGNYTIEALVSGALDPARFAEYSSEELNPNAQRVERDQYTISTQQTINWKTTEVYTCERCKQSKCSYYSAQTRSADEPETMFFKCHVCGNEWSDNN